MKKQRADIQIKFQAETEEMQRSIKADELDDAAAKEPTETKKTINQQTVRRVIEKYRKGRSMTFHRQNF